MSGSGSRAPRRRIEAPVFVVGCCNSGTTILREALRAHPDLAGPACEGQDLEGLPPLLRHFLGRQTSRMYAHPRFREAYRATERELNGRIADRIDGVYAEHARAGRRFLEKSPANAMRTRFLQALYPDASFVVIVRDGLAVSEGIRRKRAFDPERPHLAGLSTTLTEAAQQWFHANWNVLRDLPHLRRTVVISYEDLVADPTSTLESVWRVCGLAPISMPALSFDDDRNVRQVQRLTEDEQALVRAVLHHEASRVRDGAAVLRFLESAR